MTQTQLGSAGDTVRLADRYVFGLEIPWLPSIHGRDAEAMTARREAFGRQIAMLRALAEGASHTSSVIQLRIVVDERHHSDRTSSVLRIILLGSARKAADTANLRKRVLVTLPPEFVVEDVDTDTLEWLTDANDEVDWQSSNIAEIRRAIESSDPEEDAGESTPLSPVLLRWTWTWVNLVASLGALHKLPRGAQLVVHLEPRPVSREALGFLREEIAQLRNTYNDQRGENPLLAAVFDGYRQWLRDLPRASLHVRVMLACPGTVIPDGVPEIVGADLTRSWETGSPVGTFDVIRPADRIELDNALALVQLLQSHAVRPPEDPELAELLHLFDPHEASAAFRIPVPGAEGLPGLRTEPTSTLPRGLTSSVTRDRPSVVLGRGPSNDTVTLAYDEINRHILVAGLPGYGKTTTVHSILRQLWGAPEEFQVPFLVLDPAKTDYRALAEQIGVSCDIVELGGDAVALNPLCCPEGVPTMVFATRIAAAFDATYDLSNTYPAAGTLLTRAVHRTLAEPEPSLPRLYATVRSLITSSNYSERVRGDLEAALANRLELLTDGSLGDALMGGPEAAVDWERLLKRPTIVLTREFAGPRERALLMSFILAGLVSYREYHPFKRGSLGHVTVLEEAHRILATARGSGFVNDGAQAFVDAMAELRGAGEGFVVVEQAPSRLVPEVRKLVGTVIAHRTVDSEERAALASSLTLPPGEQALARLQPGHALVLAADMLTPAVVVVEPGNADDAAEPPTTTKSLSRETTAIRLWCQQCPVVCTGYAGARAAQDARRRDEPTSWPEAFKAARAVLRSHADLYCAAAFTEAQRSINTMEWDQRRRSLLRTFAKHDRKPRQ